MKNAAKVKISGWGNYPVAESYLVSPGSADEIKALLGQELIARGLGRSYGDQAINRDRLVALTGRLDNMISFDPATGILECQAGVSLEDIILTFAPRGWFPYICPGTKFVTVGGAIANDIHGKAHHRDGSFVNSVISFTIMLANGETVTASRTENSDLFTANFGGLGLLGVILTARLQLRRIESTYFRQKSVAVRNLDELLEALEKYRDYHYSVAWIDPLAKGNSIGSGVLTVGNAASPAELPEKLKADPFRLHPDGKLTVPVFLPDFTLNSLTSGALNRVIGFIQNNPAEYVHYEKFFFPLDMINNWNRGYGRRGFIQYQFVIPKEKGKKNLTAILENIASSGCTPFLNVFKLMGKGQGLLSFPFEGYTLAIDFPVSERLKKFVRVLDEQVLSAGGRIYLGKDALLSRENFYKMYPEVHEWLKIKAQYDPNNVFTSDLSRRLGLHPG